MYVKISMDEKLDRFKQVCEIFNITLVERTIYDDINIEPEGIVYITDDSGAGYSADNGME